MTAASDTREWELARTISAQSEVLRECPARDLRDRRTLPLRLAIEGLCKIVREGHGGALHTRILASHPVSYLP